MKVESFYLLAFVGSSIANTVQQQPFVQEPMLTQQKALHGRFLHITDIHMDKHYIAGATIKSDCHREPKKHKKKKERQGLLAGYWGAPGTDCDSPKNLVRTSIDTIAKEWKDKIDFVIWTGDNARHDGDAFITRTKEEIIGYNEEISTLLKDAFRLKNNKTLPIVPCIGNNDVHPHNELRGIRNNPQLLEFSALWSDFIPPKQIKAFRRGGYFAVDVVRGLRVLSLNSLYFFGSNDVANGCSDLTGPGARHIRWMKKQLNRAREDGVKVILIGHVPPTIKTFKDSCLDDYIRVSTEYADIITGHMYGHANMDHFQVLTTGEKVDNIEIQKDAGRFISTLHKQYKKVGKNRNKEELVVIHVAPPMLPLFYPTFRINEYETNLDSNKFGDWLKYTQYFTNLTHWNQARDPTTGKHLKPEFEIEYSTDETYNMTDLTANSWLDFAEKITSEEGKELWKTYLSNMFVQTNNDWYEQSIPVQQPTIGWLNWFYNRFF